MRPGEQKEHPKPQDPPSAYAWGVQTQSLCLGNIDITGEERGKPVNPPTAKGMMTAPPNPLFLKTLKLLNSACILDFNTYYIK